MEMKCPYCNSEMEKGEINQDRYALKWKSEKKGAKSVKLTSMLTQTYASTYVCVSILVSFTSMLTQTYVDAYLCRNCNKIIIDVDSVEE